MPRSRNPLSLLFLWQLAIGVTVAFAPPNFKTPNTSPIIHGVLSNSLLAPSSTSLHAKKKGGVTTTSSGKIQVKLLKHVAGTGHAGQVIMVTPAFFNNKLRPTQSALVISNEEVAREQKEVEQHEKEAIETAKELQATISELTLKFLRKAGPDGQLFGGINAKTLITELQGAVDDKKDFLSQKHVKIADLYDEEGKKMNGDIKHIGKFSSTIFLRADISAKFDILVEPEA